MSLAKWAITLQPIDLGAGRKPVAVAIGFQETCVALDEAVHSCVGLISHRAPTTAVAAPADGARVVHFTRDMETLGVFDDGTVRRISLDSPSGPTPVDFGGPPGRTFVAGAATPSIALDCVILRVGGAGCTGAPNYARLAHRRTGRGHRHHRKRESPADSIRQSVVTCWEIQAHPEWNRSTHVPLGSSRPRRWAQAAEKDAPCWQTARSNAGRPMERSATTRSGGSASRHPRRGGQPIDLGMRPAP